MTALTAAPFDWPGSAAQTARRVIEWAASPAGHPPHGSVNGVRGLPGDAAAQRALRGLARATAARLGAGQPGLGDQSAIGPGALFLAAAIGGRSQPELSARLAALVAPPVLDRAVSDGWADAIARHAVLAPALAPAVRTGPASGPVLTGPAVGSALAAPLRESLLLASPLSAVLFRPAEGQHTRAVNVALGMLTRQHGTAVLATVLSGWHAEAAVLDWRAKLLYNMAAAHPAEVIEVYAAARLCHGADWDRRIAAAADALKTAAEGEPDLRSVATIQYWAPLLVRQVRQRLRRRPLLGGYKTALDLVQDHGLETVGAL